MPDAKTAYSTFIYAGLFEMAVQMKYSACCLFGFKFSMPSQTCPPNLNLPTSDDGLMVSFKDRAQG